MFNAFSFRARAGQVRPVPCHPCTPRLLAIYAVCLALVSSTLSAEEIILAKKSPRGVLWVTPVEHVACASEGDFIRGETVLLTGNGFAAKESVRIALVQGDAEVQVEVTSVTANADGSLQSSVAIPADAATGPGSRFLATGDRGEGGDGRVLNSAELGIFADAGDSDGDDVQDICDNCIAVANADLADDDADEIGDACDTCPHDMENDTDGDGICGDVDPDPYGP